MVRNKPKAIGCHIYAGGFTLGVRDHFDVACVLEETPYGVATARHNMPEIPHHVGISNWPINDLKRHEWDLVYGNCPCAVWSQNGKNVGANTESWRTDPRVQCTRNHFSLLRDLCPRVWVWESVQQTFTKGRDFVDELTAEAVELGYSVTYLLHDAQWLGVPQRRKRFFFVAHKMAVSWPTPNWAPPTTPVEALDGIVPRDGPAYDRDSNVAWTKKLHLLKPGERLYKLFERVTPESTWKRGSHGQVIGRPAFGYVRLPVDRVGPATVGYAMVHPTEHRWITVNEMQVLASFPDDFEFVSESSGNKHDTDRIDLIARGVCPGVAAWLARTLAAQVDGRDVAPVVSTVDISEPPRSVNEEERVVRRDKSVPPSYRDPVLAKSAASIVPPGEGVGSGAYIRSLLVAGRSTEDILAAVHANYPASKATAGDVAWNRGRLRKEGVALPTTVNGKAPVSFVAEHVAAVHEQAVSRPRSARPKQLAMDLSNERQPQAEREGVDPAREFDTSSLRRGAHGKWVHRDYLAHAFRWGFAGRFVTSETRVLDVGCGPDVPMIDALTMPRNQVPKSYVGVDLNREPRSHPTRQWATLHWEFDFTRNFKRLGQYDLVLSFEALEHMRRADGVKFLTALRACLAPEGTILLSTPNFNGKAAANHIFEWKIEELNREIIRAKLQVKRRFGTFASSNDIKKVASKEHLKIAKEISEYYSGEVMACFLSPLYPDASRNNIWVLQHV